MLEKIKSLAGAYKQEFIDLRRHLHANPELSYEERATCAFVCEKLKSWRIPFQVIAVTGVVAIIEGRSPQSRIIALRADMDALPIAEENEVDYRSKNPGVMHACGHDVHTTCLLGAAKILQELRAEWEGTVKLIFQPGEEKNPGGATLMIKDGVLENPAPVKIFGLHVHPGLQVGEFSFRGGKVMASTDEIYISIKGKGGHAAAPQLTADTVLAGSQLVVALQQVMSRHKDPFTPSVLSITAFNGGNTTNVIPAEVKLMGTLRAMDESWQKKAHQLIRETAAGVAQQTGAEIFVNIDIGYPVVNNDEALSAAARTLAEEFVGKDKVSQTELRMGAEDFAFYSQLIPACFFRLGVGNKEKGITANVHTPRFNIDEDAISEGVGMMAWLGMKG